MNNLTPDTNSPCNTWENTESEPVGDSSSRDSEAESASDTQAPPATNDGEDKLVIPDDEAPIDPDPDRLDVHDDDEDNLDDDEDVPGDDDDRDDALNNFDDED